MWNLLSSIITKCFFLLGEGALAVQLFRFICISCVTSDASRPRTSLNICWTYRNQRLRRCKFWIDNKTAVNFPNLAMSNPLETIDSMLDTFWNLIRQYDDSEKMIVNEDLKELPIKMNQTGDVFDKRVFMVGILSSSKKQELRLSKKFWSKIERLFQQDGIGRGMEIMWEVLFLLFHVDAKHLHHRIRGYVDESVEAVSSIFEIYADGVVESMFDMINDGSPFRPADTNLQQKARRFLKQSATIDVIVKTLQKLEFGFGEDRLRQLVDNLKVWVCDKIPKIQGGTTTDGFFIVLDNLAGRRGSARFIANFYAVCVHEMVHYLAGTYWKHYNPNVVDDFVRLKSKCGPHFELGEEAEKLMYGGMVVSWELSDGGCLEKYVRLVESIERGYVFLTRKQAEDWGLVPDEGKCI